MRIHPPTARPEPRALIISVICDSAATADTASGLMWEAINVSSTLNI